MAAVLRGRKGKVVRDILYFALVAIIVIPFCSPSLDGGLFRENQRGYHPRPRLGTFKPTTMHYRGYLPNTIFRYMFNSAVIAFGSTFCSLLLGLPAAIPSPALSR